MIEIMGLPGSGKSYILNKVEMMKIKKITESVFYDECKKISFFSKINYLFYTLIMYFDVFLILFVYILLHGDKKTTRLMQLKELFKYLVLFNCIVKRNTTNDIIVLDQGLLQFVWSIDLLDACKYRYNIFINYVYSKFIKKYNIIVAYYKVDYLLAANRATSREKKSKFDYMNTNEISELYKKHYYDYNIIKKYSNKQFFMFSNLDELIEIIKRNFD